MPTRLLVGLGIGSGFEAADAVAVRADGFGLGMTPRVVGSARVQMPADVRDAGRELLNNLGCWPAEFGREVGDILSFAVRQAAGVDVRSVLAAGLLGRHPDPSPADWLAERTGLTVLTGFAGRDVAAGGIGSLLTPAADFLLFRDPSEERLLVHLGSQTTVVLLPASDRVTQVVAFECGPGNRLLDDITSLGTRGRESFDPSGTKAVQGRCDDALPARWSSLQFLGQRPPRAIPRSLFGPGFLTDAFEAAREHRGSLNDLLCTATHFVARCVKLGCERWLPVPTTIRRVFVSGGGARNGFLWKLLSDQFPGQALERLDALGVPGTARSAAAAAVLTGLTLDGVAASLPLVTGASGARLVGRLIPGDHRNWATCVVWMSERQSDYASFGRAA